MSEGAREVATVAGDVTPHPTISLLSLPDDLLLSIYEQVYEERCENTGTNGAPRVAEILVNKRLFRLARPLWFSRMTIPEEQLDRWLSGLLDHKDRRQSLRRLELSLVPGYALLTKLTLARLPHLTHLSVTTRNDGNDLVHDILEEILSSKPSLRHLTMRWYAYSDKTFELLKHRLNDAVPPSLRSWTVYDDSKFVSTVFLRDGHLIDRRVAYVGNETYRTMEWSTLESCRCGPVSAETELSIVFLLEGLAARLEGDELSTAESPFIPLRRLALDLHLNMGWDQQHDGTSPRLDTLFRLLPLTRVEVLEFTSALEIPKSRPVSRLPSVKVLRISGPCTFRDKTQLEALNSLLSMCPALSQLHIIGDKFFDLPATSADHMSRLGTVDQCLRYPELYALLFVLSRTKVKLFTYRAEDERREIRWTRMDEKEDFDVTIGNPAHPTRADSLVTEPLDKNDKCESRPRRSESE